MKSRNLSENVLLSLLTFGWVLPAAALLATALRSPEEVASSGWWHLALDPWALTLENFHFVLTSKGLGRAFLNSTLIAIPATALTVGVAALAAFGLLLTKTTWRRLLLAALLGLQGVPLQMALIPLLQMLGALGLNGRYAGLWLAHAAFGLPFGIFLMHNGFAQIPRSLLDAAAIDGASLTATFTKIILPLSTPTIASLAIFQFLWVWNDLLVALVVVGGSPGVAPLTARIVALRGSLEAGWHIQAAAAFVASAVPVVVFLLGQRAFARGLMAGATKG